MAKLNLTIDRGTSFILHYTHQHDGVVTPLTGATVYFTAKSSEYSTDTADSDAVVKKTLVQTSGGIPNYLQGECDIEILPADTENVTPGKLFCDIRVKESDGRVYKMLEGVLKIDGSPTNRASV